ncbi:hypothetical protein ACU8KH_06496 [Lachancea thermotolerans]
MRLALGLRIYNYKYYCIQGSRLLTANFIIIQKLIIQKLIIQKLIIQKLIIQKLITTYGIRGNAGLRTKGSF